MSLIIACHFLQAYGYTIAFLFNVGVQVFFLTSGFLYGKIEISNPFEFYKKRIRKIYVPYALVVSAVLTIQSLLGMWQFTIRDVIIYALNLQGFVSTTIAGLNHLWFLSVLMICYILAPWLQRLLKWNPLVVVVFVICASFIEFLFVQKMYSTCAWILLFTIGMLYGKYETPRISIWIMFGSAIVLVGMLPFFHIDFLLDHNWAHYCVWLHCALAIFIFTAIYYVVPKIVNAETRLPILHQLDTISYEVYLIHHPLIMGPLALLSLTPYSGLNITIILLATCILSYVCMYVCMYAAEIEENYDTKDYSLLLVWRQTYAGVGTQVY